MSYAQSGVTFVGGLKLLGINLPSNAYEVIITCNANKPARVAVAIDKFAEIKKWEVFNLVGTDGRILQAKDFFHMVKDAVPMSENMTTSFKITATPSEIAEITIKSAFPIGGLDCLGGYSLKGSE